MSTRNTEPRWMLLASCCVLVACSSGQPDRAAEKKVSTEQLAEPEVIDESPAPAPAIPAPLAPAPEPPGEQLYAHREAALEAERAILAGDLTKAAPHLAWLAHHEYPSKLKPAWQPYAARMQLAARVLARAKTVGAALRALPALDAACGACHAALAETDFTASEGPLGHGDGAYALLDGLSGPADKVFARAAWATPRLKDMDKADDAALKALQEGSARAEKATTWVERLAATEALYAQCGSCHVGMR